MLSHVQDLSFFVEIHLQSWLTKHTTVHLIDPMINHHANLLGKNCTHVHTDTRQKGKHPLMRMFS